MRPMHILSYAALILLAEAAIGSVPGVIAVREGGMGLGSALIVGQATGVAGVALGAVAAAHLVDRRSIRVALLIGGLLLYGGLIGVGHQPAHHLGWVVVILGVTGIGMGMVLTAAFSAAAGVTPAWRAASLAVLLLAPIAASILVGTPLFQPGPPTLVAIAAIVVAGAVLIAWTAGGRSDGAAEPQAVDGGRTMQASLTGGSVLALGIVATLWGIEPSRVSVTMVATSLGMSGIGSLDGLQVTLLVGGLALVVAGGALLVARSHPTRTTLLAALASGGAAAAAAGLLAIAGFSMPRELSPPDSGGGPIGTLIAVIGGGAGLAVGAWLLARDVGARIVAFGGSLVLAALAVVAVVGGDPAPGLGGAAAPIAGIALAAFGGALVAVALRFILAGAPLGDRGLAAGAGVAAAAFGAMAGLMLGAAEGMSRAIGTAAGISVGTAVILVTALAALGIVAALPAARSSGQPERADVVVPPA